MYLIRGARHFLAYDSPIIAQGGIQDIIVFTLFFYDKHMILSSCN